MVYDWLWCVTVYDWLWCVTVVCDWMWCVKLMCNGDGLDATVRVENLKCSSINRIIISPYRKNSNCYILPVCAQVRVLACVCVCKGEIYDQYVVSVVNVVCDTVAMATPTVHQLIHPLSLTSALFFVLPVLFYPHPLIFFISWISVRALNRSVFSCLLRLRSLTW